MYVSRRNKISKKKAKPKTKSDKAEKPIAVGSRRESISIQIRKARNGFVVSSYDDRVGRDITYIAKTKAEAKNYMDKIMRGK